MWTLRTCRLRAGWWAVAALGCAGLASASPSPKVGGFEPKNFGVSPDTTMIYFGDPLTDHDASVAGDPEKRYDFGPLPAGVAVTGFHGGDETVLFAIDSSAILDGVPVTPQDVVITDGRSYEVVLKGSTAKIPRSLKIDAVTSIENVLFISLDGTMEVANGIAGDEDLLLAEGDELKIFFDGSMAMVPPGLDLDAAHIFAEDKLAFSFDGSGKIGGFHFDDEDVLLFNPPDGWALIYDGSVEDSEWVSADLEGLFIVEGGSPPNGQIFDDGFESGKVNAWSSSVP